MGQIASTLSRAVIAVFVITLLFTACQESEPPTSSKDVADKEEEFQSDNDVDNRMRSQIRSAVVEFVKSNLPNWKLKGVSTELYQFNVFWVAADIEKDGHGLVLNLAVRKFFPESGEAYWKVVPLRKTLEDQLHDMNDAAQLKKLNEATEADEGRPDPY